MATDLDNNLLHVVALIVAWSLYFFAHSLLASLWMKRRVARRWPGAMPGYRLLYNLLAMLLLIPPVWLTFARHEPWLWQWQGAAAFLANGLAILALGGFVWSLRYYDGGEFLGLRQWRGGVRTIEDQEHLHISPLHRFIRHPWYSLGLVILWTRDMNLSLLVTALLITLYLLIGSRLEERKLVHLHGDLYRQYRARVPAIIPLPWRYLDRGTTRVLRQASRQPRP